MSGTSRSQGRSAPLASPRSAVGNGTRSSPAPRRGRRRRARGTASAAPGLSRGAGAAAASVQDAAALERGAERVPGLRGRRRRGGAGCRPARPRRERAATTSNGSAEGIAAGVGRRAADLAQDLRGGAGVGSGVITGWHEVHGPCAGHDVVERLERVVIGEDEVGARRWSGPAAARRRRRAGPSRARSRRPAPRGARRPDRRGGRGARPPRPAAQSREERAHVGERRGRVLARVEAVANGPPEVPERERSASGRGRRGGVASGPWLCGAGAEDRRGAARGELARQRLRAPRPGNARALRQGGRRERARGAARAPAPPARGPAPRSPDRRARAGARARPRPRPRCGRAASGPPTRR